MAAVGEHGRLVGVLWAAAVEVVPLLAKPLERLGLERLVVLDDRAGSSAVAEERRTVQFGGPRQADRVPHQGRGDVAVDAVRREATVGEDLVLPEVGRGRLLRLLVGVAELAVLEPLGLHPGRVERDQLIDRASPARLDLGVAHAPEHPPRLHEFLELIGRHPVVRLVGQNVVERVLLGDLLAVRRPLVEVERQAGDALADDLDRRQDAAALEACLGGDGHAGDGLPLLDDLLEHAGDARTHFDDVFDRFVFVGH
jgi:hypothetical protein